ncbi:uncharacterized protein F4812DRAFT_402073 [Daldinia caldariorum]|uniref:uncharacterized protein n=1 Tax=Daldinia caldariorum TaxID=326644 RepID=UPI002007E995|nr:uncharacterized protein F4812DRAFT_402073 [Daldinia caldariorum]KAI1467599.1 hypothetical protein F4812DRAFT_402073 [Daldinia caldariorum]
MGGSAFSSGSNPLSTPRMSPHVYRHVLDTCHAKLRELFTVVASPIEGPAKKDYGDIDILVAWEKDVVLPSSEADGISSSELGHYPLEFAACLLGAKHVIKESPTAAHLAIPWPEELRSEGPSDDGPRYIQVDLHVYDSIEHLNWMLFKNAHGDLWNVLGSTIRPYGLTVDEVGLYMRIPEIEHFNKKQAKVLLTTDPFEILRFLGLRYESAQWERPFGSPEELMEYAATCRFLWVRPEQDNNSDNSATEAGEGGDFDKNKMKSTDRRRAKSRELFRRWYEEFIPACRAAGRFATPRATRDSVRGEAFETFPGTRQVYQNRLVEWRKERQRYGLWREVIKASIPQRREGDEEEEDEEVEKRHLRSLAAKALKKIVMSDDYSLGIRPPIPLRNDDGFYIEERVEQFVVDNWRQIGQAAWEENQKKSTEKLAEQTAKSKSKVAEGNLAERGKAEDEN